MSQLTVEGAAELAPRLHALDRAIEAGRPMLPDDVVDQATQVRVNAGERLARGDAAVVVALAGGTGSGKSTLFNALAGDDIASVGVRRPTTTDPVALIVGEIEGADALLDWLEVRKRHTPDGDHGLDPGLILLDLPDHDSIREDHRETVDRLVQRVDVMLWVLDPQKYAQGLLHKGYLRDLRQHAEVQLVALNKIDELSREERDACVGDLARIMKAEGLGKVPVLPVSAREGTGLRALRAQLSDIVGRRTAVVRRIDGDLRKTADDLAAHIGLPPERPLDPGPLVDVVAGAARIDDRAESEGRRYAAIARRRTRPPVLRALTGLTGWRRERPSFAFDDTTPTSNDPSPVAVQHALHELAARYGRGLARPWRSRLRDVALHTSEPLQTATSKALSRVTAQSPSRRWWRWVAVVWGAFELVALLGIVWLALIAAVDSMPLSLGEPPAVGGTSLPIVMTVGGAVGWFLTRLVRQRLVAIGARRHAERLAAEYHAEIGEAVKESIAPLAVEIATFQRLVDDLRTVVG